MAEPPGAPGHTTEVELFWDSKIDSACRKLELGRLVHEFTIMLSASSYPNQWGCVCLPGVPGASSSGIKMLKCPAVGCIASFILGGHDGPCNTCMLGKVRLI